MYRAVFICANGNEYCDNEPYENENDAWVRVYESKNCGIYCEESEIVDGRVEEW